LASVTAFDLGVLNVLIGLIPLMVDGFVQAESDTAFASIVKDNGFGELTHNRAAPTHILRA
jgi:hypothetical protein